MPPRYEITLRRLDTGGWLAKYQGPGMTGPGYVLGRSPVAVLVKLAEIIERFLEDVAERQAL